MRGPRIVPGLTQSRRRGVVSPGQAEPESTGVLPPGMQNGGYGKSLRASRAGDGYPPPGKQNRGDGERPPG
jgi:hypothetical protein